MSERKIAIVTGAGTGVGRAAALALMRPRATKRLMASRICASSTSSSRGRTTEISPCLRFTELSSTVILKPLREHSPRPYPVIDFIRKSPYGNQASLFTTSGAAARKFRYEAPAGNIGINIGVAAPMAYFPFNGWKESFFGILHAQGKDAVEFFTESKIVIERWSRQETRKF